MLYRFCCCCCLFLDVTINLQYFTQTADNKNVYAGLMLPLLNVLSSLLCFLFHFFFFT